MHVLVSYSRRRENFQVNSKDTVSSLKARVLDVFHIDIRKGDQKCVVLNYQGADLNEEWVLSEIGIKPGVTLQCCFREEFTTKLFVYCAYNGDTVEIVEDVDVFTHTVGNLRSMITRRTGLPVTTFRLTKDNGTEMYDGNLLETYDIKLHDTVRLETWDGWNEFLKAAMIGQTEQLMRHVIHTDEGVCKFQLRVALFIAAHHGHMDLASAMLKRGVRSDEPLGEHPAREWCSNSHIEAYKAPVHEAAEHGQVGILRLFVYNNICCVASRDGNGLSALNVAFRKQQREAAIYLLSKQWNNLQFSALSLPLHVYAQMRKWCDRAKERVLLVYGPSKSSIKQRKLTPRLYSRSDYDVYVDGFTRNTMNSNPKPRQHYHQSIKVIGTKSETVLPRLSVIKTPALVNKYRTRYSQMKIDGKSRYSSELDTEHCTFVSQRNQSIIRSTPWPQIPISTHTNTPMSISTRANFNQPENKDLKTVSIGIAVENDLAIARSDTKFNHLTRSCPGIIESNTAKLISRSAQSIIRGEKTRMQRNWIARMESSVSLPAISTDHSPDRPFFHASTIANDIPRRMKHAYDKINQRTSLERAINSLTFASAFTDKPWLHQVKLAMDLSETNVKKSPSSSNRRTKSRKHKGTSISVK